MRAEEGGGGGGGAREREAAEEGGRGGPEGRWKVGPGRKVRALKGRPEGGRRWDGRVRAWVRAWVPS